MGMHLGMHRRHAATNALVNVLVPVFLVWGLTAAAMPAHAAPRSPAARAAVTETFKVILPETSIAGPGFDGQAIAWTGTDAAHHVNLRVGTNGVNFPTKTTLPETSPFGPSLAPVPVKNPLPNAVAWTGTDANHSLNVQIIPGGTKLTLHESSSAAPALDFATGGAGALLLAWTGTDANHSLNTLLLTLAPDGKHLIPGAKTVLRQFSSDAGPSLLGNAFTHNDEFILGWSVRGTQQLNFTTDFSTSAAGSGLPETSATAPQFVVQGTVGMCMSWTGTDAANHLNVQCTTQFPQFPDPALTKTVLPETALGIPGMSIGGGPSFAEIAWTGTDPAQHLNVAGLQGS